MKRIFPSVRSGLPRRAFLRGILASAVAPMVVLTRVLGAGAGAGPSPSSKISLGVIGVGAQGTADMGMFLGHRDVHVTAVCDVNQRNIERARQMVAKAYGSPDLKVYSDFRELNADRSIDAVLMALPVHWHSIPALDAILNGKHIYHEKPMGMSFAEARRVRDAVKKKGVVFQFGTQQRSDQKFRWACELARNGRLGKLQEIRVSVPGGKSGPGFAEQPAPGWVDWNRWVGPAPMTPFHEGKLSRDNHENMTNFSLGMISCWGIHHLDIAQWGNNTDETGPATIEGTGVFPKEGGFDAVQSWKVRFEFAKATPVVFVSDGTAGFDHGVRFVGSDGWVHVVRGDIRASSEKILTDPDNKEEALKDRLPVSQEHTRDFVDAIHGGRRAICDIGPAVRGDTLCQMALIAVKQGRKLRWDPVGETFVGDDGANAMLQPRPFRGDWRLPAV